MSKFTKELLVSLIDFTSLNNNDNYDVILNLCEKSRNKIGTVAALCVYKDFVPQCKNHIGADKNLKDVKVATVINFPNGNSSLEDTLKELEKSLILGADEIDVVMPYTYLINNSDSSYIENFLKQVRKECNKTLKVILEVGELQKESLIRLASKIAINEGADFIKTSTGKVKINSTLEYAKYMLEEIKKSNSSCGFKAAGGIKTQEEAKAYLQLTEEIMTSSFINNKTFRFGASSLLNNILDELGDTYNY